MAKVTGTQKLGSPISVEFGPDGRQQVRLAAFLSERSLSAFVREAALKAADRVVNNEEQKAA